MALNSRGGECGDWHRDGKGNLCYQGKRLGSKKDSYTPFFNPNGRILIELPDDMSGGKYVFLKSGVPYMSVKVIDNAIKNLAVVLGEKGGLTRVREPTKGQTISPDIQLRLVNQVRQYMGLEKISGEDYNHYIGARR